MQLFVPCCVYKKGSELQAGSGVLLLLERSPVAANNGFCLLRTIGDRDVGRQLLLLVSAFRDLGQKSPF